MDEDGKLELITWQVFRGAVSQPLFIRAHVFGIDATGLNFYRFDFHQNDSRIACIPNGMWELVIREEDDNADKKED